jgi:hypothetical protein
MQAAINHSVVLTGSCMHDLPTAHAMVDTLLCFTATMMSLKGRLVTAGSSPGLA